MKKFILTGITIIMIFILFGCTQEDFDVTDIAKASPQISEFLNTYPQSKIIATYYSSTQIQDLSEKINEDCETTIEITDYYRIKIDDLDYNASITAWMRNDNKKIICIIKNPGTKPIIQINDENCPEIEQEFELLSNEADELVEKRKNMECSLAILMVPEFENGCSTKEKGIETLKKHITDLKQQISYCENEFENNSNCEEKLKNLKNEQETIYSNIELLSEKERNLQETYCQECTSNHCQISFGNNNSKTNVFGECTQEQIDLIQNNVNNLKIIENELIEKIDYFETEIEKCNN
jgi:hypothetical protein